MSWSPRGVTTLALTLPILLPLSGCSSSEPSATSEPDPTVTVTERVSKAPRPQAPATPGPTGAAAIADLPVVESFEEEDELYFESPTGNITCWLRKYGADARSAACFVSERAYLDPVDSGCELDFLPLFTLDEKGVTYGACQGDIAGVPGDLVLDYGTAAVSGPLRCGSLETGVTCTHSESGHGFTLSRESYTVF